MALTLDTWYSQEGTNPVTTNRAGIDYIVTRTPAQELANQSQIQIKPWIKKTVSLGAYDSGDATMTIKCSGQTKTSVLDYNLYDYGSVDTKYYLTTSYPFRYISGSTSPYTYIVNHNTDGTLSNVNLYALIPLANAGSGEDHVVNINVSLPTIPRGSILGTISNFTLDSTEGTGVAFPVPCTKYSDSFYDVLTIKIANTVIATRNDYLNGDVILSSSEIETAYDNMTSSNSVTFTFELKTYSDSGLGTQIGITSTKTATGSISSTDRNPLFAPENITYADTIANILALTGSNQIIVKGYSNPAISINTKATANKGAIFNANCYAFTVNAQTQYASQTETAPITKTFANITSNQFIVSVTDSRGNTTSNTKTYSSYVEYIEPIISSVALRRTNDVEMPTTITVSGRIWKGNFGIQNNAITALAYQFKETTATEYTAGTTNLTTNVTYNSETGEFNLAAKFINGDKGTSGFDSNKSFNIKVTVTDKVTSYSYDITLDAGIPGTYLQKFYDDNVFDGYGFGIGMKPTGKGLFVDFGNDLNGSILNVLCDLIYPVGSIYISVNNANPSGLFGGTWDAFGTGRTLVGINASDTSFNLVEKTGGHKDTQQHTHAQDSHNHTQNPHTHGIRYKALTAVDGSYVCLRRVDSADSYDGTDSDAANASTATNIATTATNLNYGNGDSGNLQPYIVVYMWKRTA